MEEENSEKTVARVSCLHCREGSSNQEKEVPGLRRMMGTKKKSRKEDCVGGIIVQLLSHVQLFGDPMGCSPPGFSVHGISQARILKGVAISFSSGSFGPTD